MSTIWIVHRDPARRAALARAAAAREGAVSGGPGDPLFDSAAPADAVVLGLAGDLEAELQFAHRVTERLADREPRWILVAERGDAVRARELFDAIDAEILSFPPDARLLRQSLRHAVQPAVESLPLSQRPARDRLSQRFARWFADLELPELLRCIDPRLSNLPVLICGEAGSGRALLGHYIHRFGPGQGGPLVPVVCRPEMPAAELQRALADAAGDIRGAAPCTIWLEDVDALSAGAQRQLARWIEFGMPDGTLHCHVARWTASAADPDLGEFSGGFGAGLDAALADVLCGIQIRIPALRERPQRIASFANDTALAWCAERRDAARRFGEDAISVLEEYPWSANLRELEAVVTESLAACASDPVRAVDLTYGGMPFAPLDAAEIGLLIDTPPPEPASRFGAADELADLLAEPFEDDELAAPILEPEWLPSPGPDPLEKAPDPEAAAPAASPRIQHLVGAIAHEIRNPLSTIRTFAELLPNRFDDPDFRETFSELVGNDAKRIEGVVAALSSLAGLTAPVPEPVPLGAMIEELLDAQREPIRERHLLVLKELETDGPGALADPEQIRFAFESIVRKSIELATDRGDVYISNRAHPTGLRGTPSIRTLVRFGNTAPAASQAAAQGLGGLSVAENALEFAIAEAIVLDQSGGFSVHASDNGQSVVQVDLPAEPV
jgi:DNA-binding NtrC family response regulator